MRRRKPTANAMRQWLSVMGRLVLVASLWHAPLPMLHAHDAVIRASSAATLADHLAEYHADVALNSHIDFGWHWHLVPPPSNHAGDESQDGPCPHDAPDTLLQGPQSVMSLQSVCTWVASAWMSSPLRATCLSAPVAPATPTQFLDTYLGSVRLGTLLRVARC